MITNAIRRDILNAALLLEEMHSFAVLVNGEAVSDVPAFVRVYVGDLNLSDVQLLMLRGFVFDPDAESYEVVIGSFSTDRNYFYFDFNGPGIVSVKIYELPTPLLRFNIGRYRHYQNGIAITGDAAPFISFNRTMVPLRVISEALGATPIWDNAARTAYIYKGDVVLRLPMGQPLPDGMGMPEMRNNRVFVPARFVIENFGAITLWDPVNREVTVFVLNVQQ